jgi:hypothetical protein
MIAIAVCLSNSIHKYISLPLPIQDEIPEEITTIRRNLPNSIPLATAKRDRGRKAMQYRSQRGTKSQQPYGGRYGNGETLLSMTPRSWRMICGQPMQTSQHACNFVLFAPSRARLELLFTVKHVGVAKRLTRDKVGFAERIVVSWYLVL